jgi:hypothetical protein
MKKFLTVAVVALFATASFAQDNKMEKKADAKSTTLAHECYMMKDGAVIHCMGEKNEALKSDVKLKNGTTITSTGVIRSKDGVETKLENGQCVSLMGSIGDCEKMHGDMSNMKEEKMHDNVK